MIGNDKQNENEIKIRISEDYQAKLLATFREKVSRRDQSYGESIIAAFGFAEFTISEEKTLQIIDEYFDTKDLSLYRDHGSLRFRRCSGNIETTLKTDHGMQLGLFKRGEKTEFISEEKYKELISTGLFGFISEVLPELKEKKFTKKLIVKNERKTFSLVRRDEKYELSFDLFTFSNPTNNEISDTLSEIEIEAKSQKAIEEIYKIRENILKIVGLDSYSKESKYERGIKIFRLDNKPLYIWLLNNWNTTKGLAWLGIIIGVVGLILTIIYKYF